MKSSLGDQQYDARAGLGSMDHLASFSVVAAPSGLDDEIPARILRAMPRSECARKSRREMRLNGGVHVRQKRNLAREFDGSLQPYTVSPR